MFNRSQHRQSNSFNNANNQTIDPFTIRPPKAIEKPIAPELRYKKKNLQRVKHENPNLPIWDLGEILGTQWENAPDAEKMAYFQEWEKDKHDYEKQLKSYYSSSSFQQYNSLRQKSRLQFERSLMPSGGNSRKFDAAVNGGVIVQPIEEENSRELNKKKIASIRYSRNQMLMAELFTPNCMADFRQLVTKNRFELFKKQEQGLKSAIAAHQADINRMKESLATKKRSIQDNHDKFEGAWKKMCTEDKPRCSGGDYNLKVSKWKVKLTENYTKFQEKQAAEKEKMKHEREQRPTLNSLLMGEPETEDSGMDDSEVSSAATEKETSVPPTMTGDLPVTFENTVVLEERNEEVKLAEGEIKMESIDETMNDNMDKIIAEELKDVEMTEADTSNEIQKSPTTDLPESTLYETKEQVESNISSTEKNMDTAESSTPIISTESEENKP
uniref:HMG box domain-containing protein n=1 Tax=Rhabditophanes sp. KR3021 TaxID=114890 RepID=A0AC35TRZ9_9BILA